MNILITGGAGFIGSNLALKLIDNGHYVTVLDNLSEQIHGINPLSNSFLFNRIKDKVNFIYGSVTCKEDWEKALNNQEIVVHFAAETGTGQSMYQILKYSETNITGTSLMLDILANKKTKVRKVVVASSRSIYGEGKYWSDDFNFPVYPEHREKSALENRDFEVKFLGCKSPLKLMATDENSKIHPSSVYGITKQNQEQMIMTVCPAIGISPVALRYQNVYGPGQSLSNPYTGILSIFSTLIRNNKSINIFEDGLESRDFVFIDDVIDATILGIENEKANGEVFNVGTGVATNVLTVAKELIVNYEIDVELKITGNFRIGDIRHNFADLTKIQNKLNYYPKVTFSEGIKKFTKWVLTQEIIKSKYDESIQEMKQKGLFK